MRVAETFRWSKRTVAAVAAYLLCAAVPAHALSEWWTPEGKRCPVFDGASACQAYCAADQSRCGGSTDCTFRTGPVRPECPMERPAGSGGGGAPADGWEGPGAK